MTIAAREALKDTETFTDEVKNRTVNHLTSLKPLSASDQRLVSAVAGLATHFVLDLLSDCETVIVDRERLAELLTAAGRTELKQDLDEE